ncbi:hypothetical protein [Aureibacter tunicatorum]|uniref:Uncharacterized protein n=1 Tax=Aureibacter tunicatorum TaxID=866807 RepID=A0AAE3XJF5_9BACT|nr:hypothetical protein [Aureibacter tunicatorum]MDR6237060.1 hypothetical protein [Aureibacter tunicatorum]BDD06052.1 hypothetical protein AUTU_35350 [Aureibacter tunicatorum]
MKKQFLLIAALASLLFSACSNEGVEESIDLASQTADASLVPVPVKSTCPCDNEPPISTQMVTINGAPEYASPGDIIRLTYFSGYPNVTKVVWKVNGVVNSDIGDDGSVYYASAGISSSRELIREPGYIFPKYGDVCVELILTYANGAVRSASKKIKNKNGLIGIDPIPVPPVPVCNCDPNRIVVGISIIGPSIAKPGQKLMFSYYLADLSVKKLFWKVNGKTVKTETPILGPEGVKTDLFEYIMPKSGDICIELIAVYKDKKISACKIVEEDKLLQHF